jgi:hypothetical protein
LSAIANMMQRAGLLSDGQVQTVHAHARDHQVGMVEAILALGFADEDAIAAFLHSKLVIPRVAPSMFERIAPETAALLPADLARTHGCIPVALDDVGNLTVAMLDPTDLRAVRAISEHTRAYVVRAVARASDLRGALGRVYDARPANEAPRAPTPTPRAVPRRSPTPPPRHAPAQPESMPGDVVPLSAEAFGHLLPRLVAAQGRDDILNAVLDFLGAGFQRVILFAHTRGELRGLDARGADLLLDAVRQVRIPARGASVFSRVISSQRVHFGPLRDRSPIDDAFDQAMGGISGNILVLPVTLADKVALLVFAGGARHAVDPRSVQELADSTSQALQRLIVRMKSGG